MASVAFQPALSCGPAMYLEKLGENHLEEALGEMDHALQQMSRCGNLLLRTSGL